VEKHEIQSGVFLGGVGMIREFEIGFWTGKEYVSEFHEEPHELIHYGGSIASVDGKPMFHIHGAVAGPDHRIMGGHLNRGVVAVLNEIFILKLGEVALTRKLNPGSGLMELFIPEP